MPVAPYYPDETRDDGRHSRRPGLHRLATDHGRQLTTNRRIIKSQSRGRTNHLTPASSGGAASPLSAVTWATTAIFPLGALARRRRRFCLLVAHAVDSASRIDGVSCHVMPGTRDDEYVRLPCRAAIAGHVPARCRGQLSKPRPWPYLKA